MNKLGYLCKVICVGLLFAFMGCSNSADMQTTPEDNSTNYAMNSCKSSEEGPFVVPIIIRKEYYDEYFCENYEELPSEMYFINSILAGYKSREIWFNDEQNGKGFIKNLEAISTSYTLSKKKNYNGIIHKLQKLENKVPSTLFKVDADVIKAIIKLTAEILKEASYSVFIVPDYLDGWSDVVSFFYSAETQSIEIIVVVTIIAIVGVIALITCMNGCDNISNYDKCVNAARESCNNCLSNAYDEYESSGDGTGWESAKDACMAKYENSMATCATNNPY